jgi:drug/metabolite transporter (DMT)-like permease
MTSAEGRPVAPAAVRSRGGWLDALLFALTLSALNVAYGIAAELGVRPVALLAWAMPSAAMMLLAFTGAGRDWARVMAHPLSLVVGGGIIAMEGVYYMLLERVTPTDGSLLVRLGVPVAMALGLLVRGRWPSRASALGGFVVLAAIAWYVPHMETNSPLLSLALGAGCACIMSARSFAAEYHPWNRRALTIPEKLRMTGLMLLVASLAGLAVVGGLAVAGEKGLLTPPASLPTRSDLMHRPTVLIGLIVGVLVLTAMQYLGLTTVVKIGAESFIATTALIPVVTLGVQELAVAVGLLQPVPVDWRVMPAMAGVMAGVVLVIWGQHKQR